MDKLIEYSYIWEEDREKYVLVDEERGKSIWLIKEGELMFFLIEDDVLANAIIERMLMAGNKVYNSIMDLQEARDAK